MTHIIFGAKLYVTRMTCFLVSGAERDAAMCDVCDVFVTSGAERDAAAGEERPVPAAAV